MPLGVNVPNQGARRSTASAIRQEFYATQQNANALIV